MKKYIVILLLVLVPGCPSTAVQSEKPLSQWLQPVSADWAAQYGTGETSQLYYNLTLTQKVLGQHARIVNSQSLALKDLVADVNDIKAGMIKEYIILQDGK